MRNDDWMTLKEEAYYLKMKSLMAWMKRVEETWFHDSGTCESYRDGGGNMFCVRQTQNGPEIHNVWRDSTGKIRQSANIKGVYNIEWYRDSKNYKKWPAWRKPPKYDRDDTPGSIFLSLEKFSDFYTFDSREIKKQNEEKKRKKK